MRKQMQTVWPSRWQTDAETAVAATAATVLAGQPAAKGAAEAVATVAAAEAVVTVAADVLVAAVVSEDVAEVASAAVVAVATAAAEEEGVASAVVADAQGLCLLTGMPVALTVVDVNKVPAATSFRLAAQEAVFSTGTWAPSMVVATFKVQSVAL